MIVFGLNGFVNFIPVPEFHDFMKLLVDSGYIYLVKGIEVIGGSLLLIPRFANAGLLLITPVVVNICAYHLFLDHRNWPVSLILALLNIAIIYSRRADFGKFLFGFGNPTNNKTTN
jgi:hypothetical protein